MILFPKEHRTLGIILSEGISRRFGRVTFSPSMRGKYGSQCCVTQGNLSLNTGPYYSPNIGIGNEILAYREVFPRVFCPAIFVSESPNSFDVKELGVVWFNIPDKLLTIHPAHTTKALTYTALSPD